MMAVLHSNCPLELHSFMENVENAPPAPPTTTTTPVVFFISGSRENPEQ